jgi:hypothetical protein
MKKVSPLLLAALVVVAISVPLEAGIYCHRSDGYVLWVNTSTGERQRLKPAEADLLCDRIIGDRS